MEERQGYIGQSVRRREDHRLVRGEGCFVGDLQLPHMLHAAFLRSPHAHASIVSINLTAAKKASGVMTALAGVDLLEVSPLPDAFINYNIEWQKTVWHELQRPRQRVLAHPKVVYVGQPVAVVVAEDRYAAEDALELIEIEYAALPAVIDPEAALATPAIHPDCRDNRLGHFRVAKGDAISALAAAPHHLEKRFRFPRCIAVPMEGRADLAEYDRRTDSLTVWSSTQVPHVLRRTIAQVLGLSEQSIRVIAPDVGGGFGAKGVVYPEEILVAYVALRLRRPVKWVESRRENFVSSAHGRDQILDVSVGFDGDGRFLALKVRQLLDSGAYQPMGLVVAYQTSTHIMGPYKVPNFEFEGITVATNKPPNAPYRGAGRPEACFVMERLIDQIAARLKLDPVEVRRANLIPAAAMPYAVGIPFRDGQPIVYDSGDYSEALRQVLSAADYPELRRQQAELRLQGRYLGIGIACQVAATSIGPFEGARLALSPSGELHLMTGACPQGQGHETTFAQVVADLWGTSPEKVRVTLGDTAMIEYGVGTFAARSTALVSAAAVEATRALQEKVRTIAGKLLEVDPLDLMVDVTNGRVLVRGAPGSAVTLAEVARAAAPGWGRSLSADSEPGLQASRYYAPPTVTWSYGAHLAVVEVDSEVGAITIHRYLVCHDSGRIVNPMLAEGQVVGGVAQGLGSALLEALRYGEDGQPIDATLMNYAVPTACIVPPVETMHLASPAPQHPLGIKGVGEAGTVGAAAVLANAVADALAPLGVDICELPLHSELLWQRIKETRTG